MFYRSGYKLKALIFFTLTLSGCIGSDEKTTTKGTQSSSLLQQLDITAPAITINGNWLTTIELGSPYVELGASAVDDIDGTVLVTTSGSIDTSVLGKQKITYTATDAAGNTGAVVRDVIIADTIAPVLTLGGSPTIAIYRAEKYVEPEGTTAIDSIEGAVSVQIEGAVDDLVTGTYTLTYSASDSSGNTTTLTRTITVLYRPLLNIQSKNYVSGTTIDGAEISISLMENGTNTIRTGVTDESGRLIVLLADDATNIIVSGDAEGYGELSVKVLVIDQVVDMFLPPVNASTTVIPAEAKDLEVKGLIIVSFPANSLVDENDVPATATMNAEITVIDPSIDLNLMPGNYETIISGSAIGHIESFGAVNVTLKDNDDNSYNLIAGKTATINIPLASDASAQPSTIPLYYFDKITGYWVEEGNATLIIDNGESYYTGSVSKLGTWSASIVYDQILINGCVRDSFGETVNLAVIETQGVGYFGQTVAVSDNMGDFSIAAKVNSTILLSGSTFNSASRTFTIPTATTNIDRSECLILEKSAIVVTLTWGRNPIDLDTQFFGPDSEVGNSAFLVDYRNKDQELNNSTINLDVDDTTSFGPEITTIRSFPYAGRYSYAINHYSGSGNILTSPARVELNFEGERFIFSPPEGRVTKCWGVFDFVVNDKGEIKIEAVSSWKSRAYCQAQEYLAQ